MRINKWNHGKNKLNKLSREIQVNNGGNNLEKRKCKIDATLGEPKSYIAENCGKRVIRGLPLLQGGDQGFHYGSECGQIYCLQAAASNRPNPMIIGENYWRVSGR